MLPFDELEALIKTQLASVTANSRIKLIQTCLACPEQYDAKLGERTVGYLRLRHGFFSVECPDSGGERVLEGTPEGDGIFTDDEREKYLSLALTAIEGWLMLERLNAAI